MLLERKQFILTAGFLSAAAIMMFGVLFPPVLYTSLDGLNQSPNVFKTGLAADAVLYTFSLILWALTPILLASAFLRRDRDSQLLHSFYHANLIFLFLINFIIVTLEFLFLIKWSYTGFDYDPSYTAFFSVQVFQYTLIFVVATAAAYSSNANAEFVKDKTVVAHRVESIHQSIDDLQNYLSEKVGVNSTVNSCFEQLKDELNYLSRFSQQTSLAKLNVNIQNWIGNTREEFSDPIDPENLVSKIEKFKVGVGKIKSQIASTK